MHITLRSVILLPVLLLYASTGASGYSTKGREFWLGFLQNSNGSRMPQLSVFISSEGGTSGTVSVPSAGWSAPFTVTPNGTTEIPIPLSAAYATTVEAVERNGVKITADDSVAVFALNDRSGGTEAGLVLPAQSLGRDYIAITYPPSGDRARYPSQMRIVAAEDGTTVEITPVAPTTGGRAAGVPFTVTLDAGESYLIASTGDLTGTRVRGVGDCRRFALFAGTVSSPVGRCTGNNHLFEQMFPVTAWGSEYITVPLKARVGDIFRILASRDGTQVRIDGGAPIALDAGEYRDTLLTTPSAITSDRPIAVAQYSRGAMCDNIIDANPFMMLLTPVRQSLRSITFNAFRSTQVTRYYLNILTPSAAVGKATLDGASIAGSFVPVPSNPAYSYAQLTIGQGNHTIVSEGGLAAYVYGFGQASYGYSSGAGVEDLTLAFGVEPSSGCVGVPVDFVAPSDPTIISYAWNFGDGTGADGPSPSHTYADSGTYRITLFASRADGCAVDSVVRTFTVGSTSPPLITADGPLSVCGDAVRTLDAGAGYAAYLWSTGESTRTIGVTSPGTYAVTVSGATGCIASSDPIEITRGTLQGIVVERGCRCGAPFLSAPPGYARYAWSNGDSTAEIMPTEPGDYSVVVTDAAGCSGISPAVTITGGARLPEIFVDLPTLSLPPGGETPISIGMRNPSLEDGCTPHTVSVTLRFDRSVAAPMWFERGSITGDVTEGADRLVTIAGPATDTVAAFYLVAALGSSESTSIVIHDIGWQGCPPVVVDENVGELTVTGICRDGGPRLFLSNEGIVLKAAGAPGREAVELRLPRPIPIRLVITDLLGHGIVLLGRETADAGTRFIRLDPALPAGRYFLRLEADGETVTAPITLTR